MSIPSYQDIKQLTSDAIGIIRKLYKTATTSDDEKQKARDLENNIVKMEEMLTDLRRYATDLNEENTELKKMLEFKETLVYDDGVYWSSKDDNKTGPYCPVCLSENVNMRLDTQKWGNDKSSWYCPKCEFNRIIY